MAAQPNSYFEQHLDFAHAQAHVVARRLPRHVAIQDIKAWAERGLWEASERFDPRLHPVFTTFAFYRIRGAIFDEIRKVASLPPSISRSVAQLAGGDDYIENNAPTPRPTDSAADQARQLSRIIRGLGAVFLAAQTKGDDGEEHIDAIDANDPAEHVADADISTRVAAARASLPERQRLVLKLHYEEFVSLTDIAARLKINKATVSREHARALEALRKAVGIDDDNGET